MAGDRLRVEPSVVRRLVFTGARGTQVKQPHRGGSPIVRNSLDDRQARTTMGAVGERVAVAPFAGVEHFGAALRTGCGVGHHAGARPGRNTVSDSKSGIPRCRQARRTFDPIDPGQRRSFAHKAVNKAGDRRSGAAYPDADAVAVVADPAAQTIPVRQAPHVRTEANALNQSPHTDQLGRVAIFGRAN